MSIYLLLLILLSLVGMNIHFKTFNSNYMDKDTTTSINGLFILIVFYSHISTYYTINYSKDFLMQIFSTFLGQLMVATFLFYSGYGIYYQITHKGDDYIKSMPLKRIIKTWIKFAIAILLFVIINLIIHKPISISNLLLSFAGWESIGNSNWYIFSILCMYAITYISFKMLPDKKNALKLNLLLAVLFILFLSIYKESHWYDTLLCYLFGMYYSSKKDSIEKVLFNNSNYIIALIISIISFKCMRFFAFNSLWYYELYAIAFIILLVLVTFKININNKVLKWFGKNLFWIYILQRIPMILFKYLGLNKYPYRYVIICLISTIILTFICKFIFDKPIDDFINYLDRKKLSK